MRRVVRALRDVAVRSIGPSALVLTYHRVTELERDPQLLAVSPHNFESHLQLLAKRYHVIPLAALIRDLRGGQLRNGSIAITFDDGYADNLTSALPLLEAAGPPATVFVSSGCVERSDEFWWDELERLILGADALPARIDLSTGGVGFNTAVDPAPPSEPGWNVLMGDTSSRQELYRALCDFFRPLPAANRLEAMEQLRAQCGAQRVVRESHRLLAPGEVAKLDASDVVDVGAHSRDHDVLSMQRQEIQAEAIRSDRDTLTEWCGRPPQTFSYPYGGRDSFTQATSRIVEDCGFSGACANYPALIKPRADVFALPRCVVRDWSSEVLDAKLHSWLGMAAASTGGAR